MLVKAVFLSFSLFLSANALADIHVIVAKNNPIETLTKKQVIAIYTGKAKTFPNRKPVDPIDYEDSADVKLDFYKKLMNRSISQINSYWARLVFTGRYVPPKQLKDETAVTDYVASSIQAIAYVKSPDLAKVKVVFVIAE